MSLLAPGIPLSLYVHLPWCVEKCPYCDFNSHQITPEFDEQRYVQALFQDVEQELAKIWGRTVESIFIGGGTPSLFSGSAVDELISGIRSRLMLRADIEITMESNPGTADASNYKAYRKAGVNRLSIGIQSFNNQQLKKLGRIHDADQASDAFHLARKAGFKRINLDLMYALPNQSIADAMDDLDRAIALEPEHISWYQLTIEPNTVFNRNPPKHLADDDLIWEIQQAGVKKLQQAGYVQYEVSAWSKIGEECEHNLNYWQFGDYLGIGAGAHGKITDLSTDEVYRTQRKKQPSHWLTSAIDTIAATTVIEKHDLALEFMMNAMRLNSGVQSQLFSERTGLPINKIIKSLQTAKSQKLMEQQITVLRPTQMGLNYLNDLLGLFMSENIKTENLAGSINIKEVH